MTFYLLLKDKKYYKLICLKYYFAKAKNFKPFKVDVQIYFSMQIQTEN